MATSADRLIRIAVLMDLSPQIIEPMLPGIRRVAEQDPQVTFTVLIDAGQRQPKAMTRFDGVIGDFPHDHPATRWFVGRPMPIVSLRSRGLPFPEYAMSHRIAAGMVVDHFLDRRLNRFAFLSIGGDSEVVQERADCFAELLAAAGHTSDWLGVGPRSSAPVPEASTDLGALTEWLQDRPRPYALLCSNYLGGTMALTACRAAGLRVPDDVAVAAIGGNALICQFCTPPLTSVHYDSERMGYEAARRCLQIIRGERPMRAGAVHLPPRGLSVRASSDVYRVDDPDIDAALRFVRENPSRRLHLEDLAEHAMVSRSTIDRKFRKLLGMTPGEMIRRIRLRRAEQLLRDSQMPLVEVAMASGFSTISQLSRDLKKHTGRTPTEIRRHG